MQYDNQSFTMPKTESDHQNMINQSYTVFISPKYNSSEDGIIENIRYDEDNNYYWLSRDGINFCKKFSDVYPDL